MTKLYEYILAQEDPFDYVYDCISGNRGIAAMEAMNELYNDIAVDCRLHPDDDFEDIIGLMLDHMEEA
jgi:hypothetical protein